VALIRHFALFIVDLGEFGKRSIENQRAILLSILAPDRLEIGTVVHRRNRSTIGSFLHHATVVGVSATQFRRVRLIGTKHTRLGDIVKAEDWIDNQASPVSIPTAAVTVAVTTVVAAVSTAGRNGSCHRSSGHSKCSGSSCKNRHYRSGIQVLRRCLLFCLWCCFNTNVYSGVNLGNNGVLSAGAKVLTTHRQKEETDAAHQHTNKEVPHHL